MASGCPEQAPAFPFPQHTQGLVDPTGVPREALFSHPHYWSRTGKCCWMYQVCAAPRHLLQDPNDRKIPPRSHSSVPPPRQRRAWYGQH